MGLFSPFILKGPTWRSARRRACAAAPMTMSLARRSEVGYRPALAARPGDDLIIYFSIRFSRRRDGTTPTDEAGP